MEIVASVPFEPVSSFFPLLHNNIGDSVYFHHGMSFTSPFYYGEGLFFFSAVLVLNSIDNHGGVMPKKTAGVFLSFILSLVAPSFSAAKFPFPQQYTYINGVMPTGISHTHVQTIYDVFVSNFYEEQGDLARIRFDTPSQTVSEGIGYGMLIMVYMDNAANNTQPKFDKLWNYYKKFPSSGSLMHWKINGFNSVLESGSATDGDIDVALALLLAEKQWGKAEYLAGAKAIAEKIRQVDVSNNLLDGGDNWNAINPSYMSTVATQLFQDIDPQGNWNTIQSSCYSHLKSSQHGTTGMWPNWTSGGVGSHPGTYGFDAARTPWRLGWAYAWFGHADAKSCCSKIVDWFKSNTGDNPGKIGQIYDLNGSINTGAGGSTDNIPTFLGPLVVAGMVDEKYQSWLNDGYTRLRSFGTSNDNYYNECLELLTMLLLTGNMPDLTKVQPKTTAKLTVTVSPLDAGTVTIDPPGGSYALNEQVTVTAAASGDQYSFIGWGGDIDQTPPSVTLTLACDMAITAVFKDNAAQDLVDDCEDGNSKTFLKTAWFTFNDSASGGKSTVDPLTSAKNAFEMADGGFESEKAAKITYKLDKGGFSGDPFAGIGFTLKGSGSPVDISSSTGVIFYYKGSFPDTTCALKIESEAITEPGAQYSYFLKPSGEWKEVNITWDDFLQPKWTKQPVKLDLTTITKLQWQIQGKSGASGELWLDDIHLVGYLIPRVRVAGARRSTFSFANPVGIFSGRNGISIEYMGETAGGIDCSLFDIHGRLVGCLTGGQSGAGNHRFHLDTGGRTLSNGSYVLRLATGGQTLTRQLTVSR